MERKELLVKDCEDAISRINSNGRFQKLAMFLLTICYTCTGAFLINAYIFLEKDPTFMCYPIDKLDTRTHPFECSRKVACSQKFEHKIYYNDDGYSWTNDFKMGCDYDLEIGLLGSLMFIGSLISSLLSSSASDYIGRAAIIKYSMFIRTFVIIIPILFRNLYVLLVCIFILGLLNSMHSTIPYILLSEYVSSKERDDYLTLMFICESFSGILSTLFFYLFQNWIVFFILNAIYGCIFLCLSFFLFESPRYLYSNKNYEEARIVLAKIAKINIGEEILFRFEKEEDIDDSLITLSKSKEITTLSIFMNKKLRRYIIIMPLIWFLDAFLFFGINFMIKYLNQDVYLLNMIIFLGEAISYLISTKINKYITKRNLMICSFLLSGLCMFIFYFISDIFTLVIILTFFSKFGASIILNISSIYTNECFPTALRGRSTAICSFLGKFGGIIAPIIVELTSEITIITSISCFLATISLFFLSNYNQKVEFYDEKEEPEEEIEEETKTDDIKEKLIF